MSIGDFVADVRRYFDRFRLQWNADFLRACQTYRHPKKELSPSQAVFELVNQVRAGWYMLEVQTNSHLPRVFGCVSWEGEGAAVHKENWSAPLFEGRISKRLLQVHSCGRLQFDLLLNEPGFELRHFRLLRVTKHFARSRMLIKLRALHPRYKSSVTRHRLHGEADFAPSASLQSLWDDYCKLFDTSELVPYGSWLQEFDVPTEAGLPDQLAILGCKQVNRLLSVVLPVYNTSPVWLSRAIASVQAQGYPHWELCIADDASPDPEIRALLECIAQADPRIKLVFRERNGHISAASNSAIGIASGKWLVLLDHDDELAPDALFWIAEAINRHPDCQLIYSDEDKMDEFGVRSDPYFKPEWNQDLFYSQNMFAHLGVYHADVVRAVGGFRVGYEGSQDYDLALRCIERIKPSQIHHIPRVLYHWRMHAQSTAQSINAKPYAMLAGAKALNDFFSRTGVDAQAESIGYGYKVRYALPAVLPLVSLIIPTRNGLKLLRQCVQSILNKTIYANFEILIVDNGSDDAATLRYLKGLSADNRIRILRDDRPFNYSQLNNTAVLQAQGDVLGLVNNDIEVISPDWLTEMVSHAVRPSIGAVGARLWYADNTLQHAGVVLGLEGFAGHVHRYLPRGNVGYCGRAALTQSFSAVTGACLVVKKSSYLQVGGLNETDLAVACNDIDFCLKLLKAGYRNLWTPWADLYHHESSTRGFDDTPEKLARSKKEVDYMWQQWGDMLRNDPAYNPNLTLDASDFGLAWPPRVVPVPTENSCVA